MTNKQQRTSEGQNLRTSNTDKTSPGSRGRKEKDTNTQVLAYVQLLGASLLLLLRV